MKVLDAYLSVALRMVVKYFGGLAVCLFGAWLFVLQFHGFFEYEEGLADLSLVELGIIFFSILLITRHIFYFRLQKGSWFSLLGRPFLFLGYLGLTCLALEAFYAAATGDLQRLNINNQPSPLEDMISGLLFLLCLYLGTDAEPEKLRNNQINKPSLKVEPAISDDFIEPSKMNSEIKTASEEDEKQGQNSLVNERREVV